MTVDKDRQGLLRDAAGRIRAPAGATDSRDEAGREPEVTAGKTIAGASGERDPVDEHGGGFDAVIRAAARELERQLGGVLGPGLFLVATPIGNLGDITLRALAVLARADVVYCEDTRHSRTLMQHFALRALLRSYHEHNAAAQRPRILDELAAGASVALISDAGTPLISDPGYKLVRDVVEAGHTVVSLPGASAVLTALTQAGLPTDAFYFAGFLPARSAARRARLHELKRIEATLVFYEAPSRVADALGDLAFVFGARAAAVARELTKLHEEVRRDTLPTLANDFAGQPGRGEYAIIVGPPVETDASDQAIAAALRDALQDMRLKDAAKAVADALGVARNRVYEIGLKLKGEREG